MKKVNIAINIDATVIKNLLNRDIDIEGCVIEYLTNFCTSLTGTTTERYSPRLIGCFNAIFYDMLLTRSGFTTHKYRRDGENNANIPQGSLYKVMGFMGLRPARDAKQVITFPKPPDNREAEHWVIDALRGADRSLEYLIHNRPVGTTFAQLFWALKQIHIADPVVTNTKKDEIKLTFSLLDELV